jgi:hypothetical protein
MSKKVNKNKPIGVNFISVHDAYLNYIESNSITPNPNLWMNFLKEIGLHHISFARLDISDDKKWFIGKIKYGI